jgi:hypothetical protein
MVPGEAMEVHCDYLVRSLRLPTRLEVERRGQVQLDIGEPEQLTPEAVGEDRVLITQDGARNPVEPHNAVEEHSSNDGGCVGVHQGDEMRVFGEAIHHGEDDGFPVHARQPLHEIHGNVRPHRRWQRQRLEQTGRLQLLGLIPLADGARPDKVAHLAPENQRGGDEAFYVYLHGRCRGR